MSTKAKIITAIVVVAIIVGVTIYFVNKKKKAATTTASADKAIKSSGLVSGCASAAGAVGKPAATTIDFSEIIQA